MVRDYQQAFFFVDKVIADIYNPGLYTLTRENMPRLSVFKHWNEKYHDPFSADIYFIKTKYFIEQPWSLKNTSDQRLIPAMNFCGTYDVKIINARKLIQKMDGAESFRTSQITELVQRMIHSMLPRMGNKDKQIDESSAQDNIDLASIIQESVNIEFNNYGLLLRNLTIRISDKAA
jgi:membrane protease subunit (stomatin/prohibitin family)